MSLSPPVSWCGGAVPPSDGWTLTYRGFDPAQEGTREALCTLGNGYWATRGAVPGSEPDDVHYPGTYLAGVYNRLTTDLSGVPFEAEHMVNAPDWAFLAIRAAGGPVLRPGVPAMIDHFQQLDLRSAVLTRINRYRDAEGRLTRVTSRQFLSLSDPQLAAIQVTVEAENWSGEMTVESCINGAVVNRNVADDRELANRHLRIRGTRELDADTVLLETVTSQSGVAIATAARTTVSGPGGPELSRTPTRRHASVGHEIRLRVTSGTAVTLEKVAAVSTSRDRAISTAASSAEKRIVRAGGFADLLLEHRAAWEELWQRFGVGIEAGTRHSLAVNLNTFQVLQAVAAAHPDLDAGVAARGLSGEGYRGHVFWDELFVYPMLTLRRPELTRALLLYRHRRLGEARAAAAAAGLRGAMFPWQSGSDGREETPDRLLNPRSGQWMPDNSRRQRHVGLGVAYSVLQYVQSTGDVEFLLDYGAEILVEVARLFASLAVYDEGDDRFDIGGVMGPDEFHDGYPDAPGAGVRNNAYTNVMTSWVMTRTAKTLAELSAHDQHTLHRLGVSGDELGRWDRISRRLRVPFLPGGVLSQFDGYERLMEFPWEDYRARHGDIGRLDLILQAEGDSTNNYRLSKQADVLMLFYLMPAKELRRVLSRMGYRFEPDAVRRTIEFYSARTSNGSTLSRLVHAWVLARNDRPRSWSLFAEALESDLADIQGGTTREGVHLGVMAGSADMVLRCYAGVETRDDALWLHPVLPAELTRASFQLLYRNQPIDVELTHDTVKLLLHHCSAAPITVCVDEFRRTLGPGDIVEVPLRIGPSATPTGSGAGLGTDGGMPL